MTTVASKRKQANILMEVLPVPLPGPFDTKPFPGSKETGRPRAVSSPVKHCSYMGTKTPYHMITSPQEWSSKVLNGDDDNVDNDEEDGIS